jgi:hypothetical protein
MFSCLVRYGLPLGLAVAAATASAANLREIVLTQYHHGLPYTLVKSEGAGAQTQLAPMLDQRELLPYWSNIIVALGYVADPRSTETLRKFLGSRSGELSLTEFQASLNVPQSLGLIAARDDAALQMLQQLVDLKSPAGVPLAFSYQRYRDDTLREAIARLSIQALGLSGRSEALAFLESRRPNARSDWHDNFDEAIALNRRVQTLGVAEVLDHAR